MLEQPRVLPFCTQCGKPLAPGYRFCSACGARARVDTPDALTHASELEKRQQFINLLDEQDASTFEVGLKRLDPSDVVLREDLLNQRLDLRPSSLVALARRTTSDSGVVGWPNQIDLLNRLAQLHQMDNRRALAKIDRAYGLSVDAADLCKQILSLKTEMRKWEGHEQRSKLPYLSDIPETHALVDAALSQRGKGLPEQAETYVKQEITNGTPVVTILERLMRVIDTPIDPNTFASVLSRSY